MTIIGLKELRNNVDAYAGQVAKGKSFIVVKQSKPIFKISPVEEDEGWETIIDFTKIKKGGVPIKDVVAAIRRNGQNSKSPRKAAKRI